MKRKILIVLSVMFFMPLFFSCFCDCEDEYFESYYESVSLQAYDTSGFGLKIINEGEEVAKNTFGLGVDFYIKTNEVSGLNALHDLFDFGFASAYATSCSCLYEETFPNKINKVTIYVLDEIAGNKIDVTESFKVDSSSSINLTSYIQEFIDNEYNVYNFNVELVSYDTIPSSTVFEIEVSLESGEILSSKTSVINFVE